MTVIELTTLFFVETKFMLKNIYDFRTRKIHEAPELNVERYECKPVAINRAKEDAMNMHF